MDSYSISTISRETYFVMGEVNEKKTKEDDVEGLTPDPRLVEQRGRLFMLELINISIPVVCLFCLYNMTKYWEETTNNLMARNNVPGVIHDLWKLPGKSLQWTPHSSTDKNSQRLKFNYLCWRGNERFYEARCISFFTLLRSDLNKCVIWMIPFCCLMK